MKLTPPDFEEMGLLAKIVGIVATIGAATLTAVIAVWRNINGRLAALDKKVDTKADSKRVESMAANLSEAFANQREDAQRATDGRDRIMDGIANLTGAFQAFKYETGMQLGRIASDMESEKRTRANSNTRIDERLTEIEQAIDQHGRRE